MFVLHLVSDCPKMKSLFVLVALIACVVGDVAVFQNCDEASNDICEINDVRIDPCGGKALCKIRKGKDAVIAFNFTPHFAATKMNASLFWASTTGDLPFPNLSDANACLLTNCPVENGKMQELNYKLHIAKIFPSGTFLLKWKLLNAENKDDLCCFKTKIVLKK